MAEALIIGISLVPSPIANTLLFIDSNKSTIAFLCLGSKL